MSDGISIRLNASPKPQFDTFFGTGTPFFYPGERISGSIRYKTKEPGQILKHKGIEVKLCCCIYKLKSLQETRELSKVYLTDPKQPSGHIASPFSISFDFAATYDYQPSYLGRQYSYTYVIIATVNRTFFPIETTAFFFIVNPINNVSFKSDLRFTINNNHFSAKFIAKNDKFSNNSIIDSKLIVEKSGISDIDKAFLQLIAIETYNNVVVRSVIDEYQILDGCPLTNIEIPVFLDLRKFKLWSIPNQSHFSFSAMYAIRIKFLTGVGLRFASKDIPIEIYQDSFGIAHNNA